MPPETGQVQVRMPAEDRRRQLLEVAIDLFSEKGFAATTTKEIAAAAGVTEAIIFRHFATKQDLYKAILDYRASLSSADTWLADAQVFMDADDDEGLIRFLVERIISFDREETRFARLLVYAALDGHEIALMHHTQLSMPIGLRFKQYISRRQSEGAMRGADPTAAIFAIAGAATHYGIQKYIFRHASFPTDDKQIIDGLVRILADGLIIRPSKGDPQ
jgi:TetR/AcrR family transcriptional regulator